eukprot:6212892-Pleurochrysis_carterae.AAC.1
MPSRAVRRMRFALAEGGGEGRSLASPSMKAPRTTPHALARRGTSQRGLRYLGTKYRRIR